MNTTPFNPCLPLLCGLLTFFAATPMRAVPPEPAPVKPVARILAEARGMLDQGNALAARGDLAGAVEPWTQAEALFAKAGDARKRAAVLVRLASAYHALGHRRQAFAACEDALDAAKAAGDTEAILAAQCARGTVLQAWDPKRATEALNEALEIARSRGDTFAEATVLNNRGNLRAGHGQFREAVADYRASAGRSKGHPEQVALALLNGASAAAQAGDSVQAGELRLEGLKEVEKLGDTAAAARLLVKAVFVSADLGKPGSAESSAEAEQLLARAQAMATTVGDKRTASLAAGQRGFFREQSGQTDEALRLTQQALFFAQGVGAAELLYRWEWQTGRVLKRAGRADEALAAYRRAVRTLETTTLRHDIALATSQRQGISGFRQHLGPLFYELADLLIQSSARLPDREAGQARLIEARNAVELLKSAELDDYLQDPCQAVARKKIRDVDSISPKTAVVYPIALPDRLELLVSLPGGVIQRIQIAVGSAELERVARDLQDKLRTRTTYEFVAPAKQLHAWLMKDMGPVLEKAGVETLVFVPDGPLRMIPMGALYDGTKFLAEKYAIAVTPGLTLMDPQASSWQTPNLLINGLSEARLGFPALPSVTAEIQQVTDAFGGMVLTNQFFTVQGMKNEFARGQYSIVHLATHGQFERDASKSFVLTYDSQLSLDGLENLIRPSQFRGQPVELLTLSACQTAAGDDRAALGLAGVAIKAGARSAMATLWCVHDDASAALVSSFYGEIRQHPTLSKARALQHAQQQVMKNPNYRHPYYWSGFLIIGNWL